MFGVVPKKHRPNNWHLSVNLSSPERHSINDAISEVQSSFSSLHINRPSRGHGLLTGKKLSLSKTRLKGGVQSCTCPPIGSTVSGSFLEGYHILRQSTPLWPSKLFSALMDAMMWFSFTPSSVIPTIPPPEIHELVFSKDLRDPPTQLL